MKVEVIPKKVNGEGDQLIDVEDLVAEKEEECLNERFQKHFAIFVSACVHMSIRPMILHTTIF